MCDEGNNMNCESTSFVEGDEAHMAQKLDAFTDSIVPPEEGAEEEYLCFKITDDDGNIIAGCIVEIDSWKAKCAVMRSKRRTGKTRKSLKRDWKNTTTPGSPTSRIGSRSAERLRTLPETPSRAALPAYRADIVRSSKRYGSMSRSATRALAPGFFGRSRKKRKRTVLISPLPSPSTGRLRSLRKTAIPWQLYARIFREGTAAMYCANCSDGIVMHRLLMT